MKRILCILLCTATFLTGCNKGNTEISTNETKEAEMIADSTNDIATLKHLAHRYDSLGDKRAELRIRQKYGSVLRNISNFEDAIRQHALCVSMAAKQKDTTQLIIAYNNQGTNFRRLGDLEEASNNHYAALKLCDKTLHDTCFVARKNRVRTYNGLGNVLLSLGNDSVAEALFRRALKGETELESSTGQAINLANIGAIKEDNGDNDSARIYYNMSMKKNIDADNHLGISLCYQYLGNLDKKAGNTLGAMDNFRRSYAIGRKTGDVWHWLKPCEAMAGIYLEEQRIDSARKYINIALDAATKIKSSTHLSRVYELCSKLHEKTGRYDMAISNMRMAQAYKDSVAIENNQIHVQNLRVKYEVDKRTAEVKKAESDAKYERNIRQITTWCCIIFCILIIVILVSQRKIIKERSKTYKLLKKIDRERQDFYRGITHQLRTPLTVIAGMTEQLGRYLPADNETAMLKYESLRRRYNDLQKLINDMIEFNKGTRNNVEISELAAAAETSNTATKDTTSTTESESNTHNTLTINTLNSQNGGVNHLISL